MSQKTIHLEKLRDVIRLKHFSLSTERTYMLWVSKFWDAALAMPPDWSRERKVEEFLTAEAKRGCAASTQNQAFNAIIFFFKTVMGNEMKHITPRRDKRQPTLEVAPTVAETHALIENVPNLGGYPTNLIARLLYGCGMRVNEPLMLRIKDVDLEHGRLRLWDTKGGQCRTVTMPATLIDDIRAQMKIARAMWEADAKAKLGVPLPHLMERKAPSNVFAWGWYWLFPAHKPCVHPRTGQMVRWRCHEANVQRAVKIAAKAVGLDGVITPHNLRHAYGTHVVDAGASVRDVQSALGHKSIETTMGYVHPDGLRIVSPLDRPTSPLIAFPIPARRMSA